MGLTLSRSAAARVARAVRRIEGQTDTLRGRVPAPNPPEVPGLYVRLTSEPTESEYEWKQLRRNQAGTDWEDMPNGLTSASDSTGRRARDIEGIKGLKTGASDGRVVRLKRAAALDDASESDLDFLFDIGAQGNVLDAMLTSRDASVLHRFGWSEVEVDLVGDATILSGGRTGTPSVEPALMLNQNPMSVTPDATMGDIVKLGRQVDSSGVITWGIDHTYYPMFAVFVFNDGGAAGDDTTDCTFTYEIRSIDNVTLATGLTPRQKRLPKLTYIAAPDFSIGYAAWGGPFLPNFALEIVLEEVEDTRDC